MGYISVCFLAGLKTNATVHHTQIVNNSFTLQATIDNLLPVWAVWVQMVVKDAWE